MCIAAYAKPKPRMFTFDERSILYELLNTYTMSWEIKSLHDYLGHTKLITCPLESPSPIFQKHFFNFLEKTWALSSLFPPNLIFFQK